MKLSLFISSLLAMIVACPNLAESAGSWTYRDPEGPDTWKHHYKDCEGHEQSPINIVPKDTFFEPGLADLVVNYEKSVSAKLFNNGHTVQATFLTGKSNISGGNLTSHFRALQMHFHWGSENSRGSEHQVGGRKFPLEIHIVHYNAEKYPSVSEAVDKGDGLAVLGILVELQVQDNPVFDVMVDNLDKARYKGNEVILPSLQHFSFLPHDIAQYYTYRGSLTTPGCFESVQWFVFNHTFPISQAQLDKFRDLFDSEKQDTKKLPLVDNYRPVQPLYGRSVIRSFQRPPFPCGKTSNKTLDCLGFADDKAVFYEATVNMCTLPATVTLKVSQPETNFYYVGTFYKSVNPPLQIGNLDYAFTVEMHTDLSQNNEETLRVSIIQVHPLSTEYKKELVTANFKEEKCQLGSCSLMEEDGSMCNRHWCEHIPIGFGKDTHYIGVSSTFHDMSTDNPSVDVNFYRNKTGKWHRTASEKFTNDEEKTVHLLETFVDSKVHTRKRRMAEGSPKWESVTFKAKIGKVGDKVSYQLFMVSSERLYHKVIKDEFSPDCEKPPTPKTTLDYKTKIAIVATVASMVALLAGGTLSMFYCKRKNFRGCHKASLIQDQDDNRL
ncbi:receptor-type tyrosine-protein phosphatase gamma-like [Stylophora pistillata]|uniref:Carbonic anhydrase n=1 Tax=Stylophora pistillata TaxID=50429 RepID=A0A2B4RPM3_STYPI|nr:receptor-type tyrosine-protein phosphatase gamma-like [Stylophora pistillata]PFX18749.1 Carbonic anhydrase [Stylophora pistillata]